MAKEAALPDTGNQGLGGMAEKDNTEVIPVTIENKDEIVEQPKDNIVTLKIIKI